MVADEKLACRVHKAVVDCAHRTFRSENRGMRHLLAQDLMEVLRTHDPGHSLVQSAICALRTGARARGDGSAGLGRFNKLCVRQMRRILGSASADIRKELYAVIDLFLIARFENEAPLVPAQQSWCGLDFCGFEL